MPRTIKEDPRPWRDLGDAVRRARERIESTGVRMSSRQWAKLAGFTATYGSQVERGLTRPSAQNLRVIAKVLDVPYEDLAEPAGYAAQTGEPPLIGEVPEQDAPVLRAYLRLPERFRELARAQIAALERAVLAEQPARPDSGDAADAAQREDHAEQEQGTHKKRRA